MTDAESSQPFGLGEMSERTALGTTFAVLLPPIGLLAFMRYYKAGNADLKIGRLIAVGLFVGGHFGGEWAQRVPELLLRRISAAVLAATAIKMFLQ